MADDDKQSNSAVDLKAYTEKLAVFLENNPTAKLQILDSSEWFVTDGPAVLTPWGDESVGLTCDIEDQSFIDALNNVFLPERYSALYHLDNNSFEVAWTALPVADRFKDIVSREFEYTHNGKTYQCKFGRSSDRLIAIASNFFPAGATNSSDYRNLFGYVTYAEALSTKKRTEDQGKDTTEVDAHLAEMRPLSFWIENLDWDETAVLDLVQHLNFYMTYYDVQTPVVNVHSPRSENIAHQPQTRYAYGDFPKAIIGKPLDDNLLHFWQASRAGDPARRFLYNYQILEYSSFVIMEENVAKSLKKLLARPHITSNVDGIIPLILEHTGEMKMPDHQKLEHLLRRTVDNNLVWGEIEQNKKFFCEKAEFDGGTVIAPIIKKDWGPKDFEVAWPGAFAGAIRNIRNALSHGREQRMTAVITPTAANLSKLQAWVPLVDVAAREVMVYRGLA